MIMAASTEATSCYHAHQHSDAGTQQMYKSEGKVESMIGNCLTASFSSAAMAVNTHTEIEV
jgi:hypothetical protein